MISEQNLLPLFSGLAGGLGLGAIVSASVQHYLSRRAKLQDTLFVERKEVFAKLLAAIARLDKLSGDSTNDSSVEYALCVAHVQLVASKELCELLSRCLEGEPGSPERIANMKALIEAMRKDLGIIGAES